MGKIRVLPEWVANKIAAGEVIERPASMAKELIENALDAGARQIEIDVQHGGKSLLRVADDGCGMDSQDARLAFCRHATSKIAGIEDLERITSFGFRGEALASIAAVARCRLVTRTEEEAIGTEVVVEGGILKAVQEHPCRKGTVVEVRDLFFNTPARRKFLKSESTELGHILDVVLRWSLSALEVRFVLKEDGNSLLDLIPTDRLLSRLEVVWGEEAVGNLLEFAWEREGIRLSGVLAKPNVTRSNRRQIHLFVNRRWVKSLPLSYAIQAGYHGFLTEGRFPMAVLMLDLDGRWVDVNVHPTKQEVRISQEQRIAAFVQEVVQAALRHGGGEIPSDAIPSGSHIPLGRVTPSSNPPYPHSGETIRWGGGTNSVAFDRPLGSTPSFPSDSASWWDRAGVLAIGDVKITRILGQIHDTFLVAETEDGMVVVDQHAADERVVYEALLHQMEKGLAQSQMLFLEEMLEVHPRQREWLEYALPFLKQVGFELEPFGQSSWIVRAAPALLADRNPVELVHLFLDQLEESRSRTVLEEIPHALAALCACKRGSVKAKEALTPQAMRALLERLAQCENPFHCPHGRPTLFHQTLKTLEKQFKRA
jgi:DNA mismatch repair protein MutL